MILFLNKVDIFKEKIRRSPIKAYFPDYTGILPTPSPKTLLRPISNHYVQDHQKITKARQITFANDLRN